MHARVGLDIGGVIRADRAGANTPDFLERPAVDGAFAAVAQIVAAFGSAHVFIISKCKETTEPKLREWLARKGFYSETGFNEANLNFCRERPDKAPIAQRLELTHFVDDRADVLWHMRGIVPNLYLFGLRIDQQEDTGGFVRVLTWEAALEAILPTNH